MDISFHYFAVKTMALKAGFEEKEAQRIALFSQHVDDFDQYGYINCSNIPDYVRDDKYDMCLSIPYWNFNPVTTAFNGLKLACLIIERNQKFVLSPFHFIPQNCDGDNKHTRVRPATLGDESLISKWLKDIKEEFINKKMPEHILLMRIGMLLHTFADTHAHDFFSGYNSWVNEVYYPKAECGITNKDITANVLQEINEQEKDQESGLIPPIGHALMRTVPDRSDVSFTMNYRVTETSKEFRVYHRDNTDCFITVCRQILTYLQHCRKQPGITDDSWAGIADDLRRAFMFKLPSTEPEKKLSEHWSSIFTGYRYHYNKEDVKKSFYEDGIIPTKNELENGVNKIYNDDFYQYNLFADTVLIRLYGPHPRR